jgi:transcriptional repressor NrdR
MSWPHFTMSLSYDYAWLMLCPLCGGAETKVLDSRPADQGGSIRRRRECVTCTSRFTTYERAEAVLLIKKRSGKVEPFQTLKVRQGFEFALADRPIGSGQLDAMVERVERSARTLGSVIDSETVGLLVLDNLKGADQVAYLRFASVYKHFQGAEDFEREMAELTKD